MSQEKSTTGHASTEEIRGRVELNDRELIVTEHHLVVTDRDGYGTATFDERIEEVRGVGTKRRGDTANLYYTGGWLFTGIGLGGFGAIIAQSGVREGLASAVQYLNPGGGLLATLVNGVAMTVTFLHWGILALAVVALFLMWTMFRNYIRSRRTLLVIQREKRSPFKIRAETDAEAKAARDEVAELLAAN